MKTQTIHTVSSLMKARPQASGAAGMVIRLLAAFTAMFCACSCRSTAGEAPMFTVNKEVLGKASLPDARVDVVVDLATQKAYLHVNGKIGMETRVCTGSPGHRTPVGTHVVKEKIARGKKSNLYHCALPYWMRLTDSGVGMHVGQIEDRPASHGCIRLPAAAAPLMFAHVKSGTRVSVVADLQKQQMAEAIRSLYNVALRTVRGTMPGTAGAREEKPV